MQGHCSNQATLNVEAMAWRFVVSILLFVQKGKADNDLLVTTHQGIIQGETIGNRLTNQPYFGFMGIPYAQPPIGDRRFKDPEPLQSWEGILESSDDPKSCTSYNPLFRSIEGEEDCLELHVFTPKKPIELQANPKPVMVWIHGGIFHTGTGSPDTYGPDYLLAEDIVVVLINYRLNVFGFLSSFDSVVPGNMGLKDQVLALQWVQKNIRAFGGDPDSVTIFGESAGGASVHYLVLSPLARGLFHRAIAQSGTAISPWAFTENTRSAFNRLADVFDCNETDSLAILQCLQAVPLEEMVQYQYNVISPVKEEAKTNIVFLPCVEPPDSTNPFLPEHPLDLLRTGKFNDVPFLIGTMSMETIALARAFTDPMVPEKYRGPIMKQMNTNYAFLLPYNWVIDSLQKEQKIAKQVKQFYFNNLNITKDWDSLECLVKATTDTNFLLGAQNSVDYHVQNGKSDVYQYYFTLETPYGKVKSFVGTSIAGPSHADDLNYLFLSGKPDLSPDSKGYQGMKKIVRLWTDFAKHGNPTPEGTELGVAWEPSRQGKKSYLEIGDDLELKQNCEKERVRFWKNLMADENLG